MPQYQIVKGEVITTPKGRRRGTIDVLYGGQVVNFFTYTIGNYPSRSYAKSRAKAWVLAQKAKTKGL